MKNLTLKKAQKCDDLKFAAGLILNNFIASIIFFKKLPYFGLHKIILLIFQPDICKF